MKKRIIASILTVIMLMTMLPTAAFAADGTSENTYKVSTAEELSTALREIAVSNENEATIVLKANVAAPGFGGIAGKKVTITSSEGNCYSISMANTLTGDVTLDAVKFGGGLIYADIPLKPPANFRDILVRQRCMAAVRRVKMWLGTPT